MYAIIVHNDQGASDEYAADTKAAIAKYLADWRDPDKLTARVLRDGREIAHKPMGRKRIKWGVS